MQTANLIVQIVTTVLYAVTLITTVFIAFRQIKNANEIAMKQSRNDFFAEYTRRYHDIIIHMPDEVFEGVAEPKGAALKYIQLYFDLCSEEYQLCRKGLIPNDVWDNWVEGMVITANNDLYRKAWNMLKANYNKGFFLFMEGEVLKIRNEK